MADFIKRLADEKEELELRHAKLVAFLADDTSVSGLARQLLTQQAALMEALLLTLEMRLELLDGAVATPELECKNTYEGFRPVVDNGVVKHIAQLGSMRWSMHEDPMTLNARVMTDFGEFVSNQPALSKFDYLVIMDDNPADKYVCPAAVMESKKLN